MWTCPKCGREFRRTNQGHYCGRPPETVDEYIEAQPSEAQCHASSLRNIIMQSVPDAQERIAWSMPRFEKDAHSISFAVCKKSISFYADAEVLESFRLQLSKFEIKKNALYLPYDEPLPADVIESIVKQCFIVK